MSIAEKLQTVAENQQRVYEAGAAGERKKCEAVHFSVSVLGSGTRRLSFALPFQPDVVCVYSIHPYSGQVADCFMGFMMDLRACGQYMGNILYCQSADTISTAVISTASGARFAVYDGESFAFELPETMFPTMIWPDNVRYAVSAVKYPEEAVADLIREQIALLPDTVPAGSSGTLKYYEASVLQCFTQAEWEALIATKPNWRFVLE